MKFVSSARFKINYVHNSICFLEKVERALILLPFNKTISAIVEFGQNNRNLVFGDSQLLIVVLIERVVLID